VLTIPPDLDVSTPGGHHTASQVLALPDRLLAAYDGHAGFGWAAGLDLHPCAFTFSLGFHPSFAGRGYEDTCGMAAVLGARLAGGNPGWPSGEAHVRGLPVTDFRFGFAVTPERLPIVEHKATSVAEVLEGIAQGLPDDAGRVRGQILVMAEQARLCACGECSCGEQP